MKTQTLLLPEPLEPSYFMLGAKHPRPVAADARRLHLIFPRCSKEIWSLLASAATAGMKNTNKHVFGWSGTARGCPGGAHMPVCDPAPPPALGSRHECR